MKKLISIFVVVLVLVFSCVPAFADSQVIDGYSVDDVPYNEAFEGVLTSSDTGSQLYSSSEDKTYKTSAVVAAPATSSSPLYSKKSVIDMIPKNIWRGNDNPTKSFPVAGGYTGVKYVWANNANPNNFYHTNEAPLLTFFKSERKYRITFTLSIVTKIKGTFDFYLASRADISTPVISLCSASAPVSGGGSLSQSSRSYSLDFVAPNGVPALTPVVKGTCYGTEFLFYINDFTVTDITTEDLDNSINQGVDRIENAGSDSPPLDTDISAFSSAIDTMNGWLDQLNEFADSIESAGDIAKDYISEGTELFNGFIGIAPAPVLALISFGIVFLVIRKIVGR